MAIAQRTGDPIVADAREQPALAELQALLSDQDMTGACLVTAGGRRVALPTAAVALLRAAVAQLARGRAVMPLPLEPLLRTQQAADLLGVSRPYLVTLLEGGMIPFTRTGAQRRVALGDVLAYRDRRDRERRQALAQMVREAEDLGLYDRDEATMPVDQE